MLRCLIDALTYNRKINLSYYPRDYTGEPCKYDTWLTEELADIGLKHRYVGHIQFGRVGITGHEIYKKRKNVVAEIVIEPKSTRSTQYADFLKYDNFDIRVIDPKYKKNLVSLISKYMTTFDEPASIMDANATPENLGHTS